MNINAGSVETMVIDVVDTLNNLLALPGSTTYDIFDTDGAQIVVNQVATVENMRAMCLIDATSLVKKDYELFLKFSTPPETPKLGPFRFRVV